MGKIDVSSTVCRGARLTLPRSNHSRTADVCNCAGAREKNLINGKARCHQSSLCKGPKDFIELVVQLCIFRVLCAVVSKMVGPMDSSKSRLRSGVDNSLSANRRCVDGASPNR